jgi:hypothetical protein
MTDKWLTDALLTLTLALAYTQRADVPEALDLLLAAKAALLREEQRRLAAAQARRSA